MLRSVWLKIVRDQRRAAPVWGVCMALLVVVTAAGWANAYPDADDRARLAAEISGSLSFGQVLYGEPVRVDQLGGFVAWRALGLAPVILGIFMILAATAVTRGAEERGESEVVLAAAGDRRRLFAEQAGGLAVALGVVLALLCVGLLVCGPAAGEPVLSPARAALAALNLGLETALVGAVALLVAQLTATRRSAATTTGVLLVAAHLWSNLGLVATALEPLRPLSPLYLAGRSTPLADGHLEPAALAALAALTAGCAALAAWLFTRRDLGATASLPLPRWARAAAGAATPGVDRVRSTRLLGGIFARGLRGSLGPVLAWGAALGAYAVLIAAITPVVRDTLAEETGARDLIGHVERGSLDTDSGFLSVGLFTLLPALLAVFALTLAASWAEDEREGRLELELTLPVSRRSYYLERACAALAGVGLVVLFVGAMFLLTAWLAGARLDWARAVAAALVLAPLGGAVVAGGYLVSAWRPAGVTATVGLAVAVSYFLDLLAPLWDLPAAVRDLSIFRLAGQPLINGVWWAGVAALVVLTVAFALAGSAAFGRRDIVK